MNVIEEKKLVTDIEEKLNKAKDDNIKRQMLINIAYYSGKQWIALDKTSGRIFEPPKESWRVRYVANRIQPIVRTELAKVFKNKAICNVIPASNEDEDIQAAEVGEKVCEALEYALDLHNSDKELGIWALTTGIGFVKPFWNPSKGVNLGEVYEGDVDKDIVNPFEARIDPTASKWEEVKWFCHMKARDIDYVKQVYGKEVKAENNVSSENLYDNQLKDINFNLAKQNKQENSVIVKEYWEKPSSKYLNGRRITIAAGQVLYYEEDIGFGEEDTTERELPFFPFMHILIPGRVWPMSVIENLIPVQREYNKSRSQIIENKNLMANPKWVYEIGSIEDDITSAPGEMVGYQKGFNAPHIEQPPAIGADVYNNLEQCTEELDYISGQHETSHGEVPSGVTSGTAISFLQEQDDTKLGPTVSNFERCKEKYMSYLLKIIKFHYNIERTLKFVGKDNKIQVFSFKGSDLTSTDVKVQAGSSLPTSKAAKQQWIMNLIDKMILDPVKDKQTIIKMLELGISDTMYDEYNFDVTHAQGEQAKWLKGDFSPIVRDFFNHEVHLLTHNKFRKGEEYEQLQPDMQQLIDMHVQEHENFVIESMPPPMEDNQNSNNQAPDKGVF